jgi:hypothetical protein
LEQCGVFRHERDQLRPGLGAGQLELLGDFVVTSKYCTGVDAQGLEESLDLGDAQRLLPELAVAIFDPTSDLKP